MLLKSTDRCNPNIRAYYPMSREELDVPAIPHFRVSAEMASDAPFPIPAPHMRGSSPSQSASFTIASRLLPVPISPSHGSSATPVEQSDGRFPPIGTPDLTSKPTNAPSNTDVRFAPKASIHNPTLEEMARDAFPPGQSPLSGLPSDNATESKANDYPYWVVALVQIAIGTLLVILVVKFANVVRESTDFAPRQVLVPAQPDSSFASGSSRVSLLGNSKTSGQATPLRPYGF